MFILPNIPYGYDDLAPAMSADTLRTHHDKHHAKYVATTNELVGKAGGGDRALEQVIADAHRDNEKKLFNNSAQAWNHAFFWQCMTPQKSEPRGDLAQAIERDFGSLAGLRERFMKEGEGHFASGWCWLVEHDGELDVISTHDADTTVVRLGVRPLLVCDLWEHAYYLDHKNDRKAFLEAFFDRLANWDFAAERLADKAAWTYPAPVHENA
jgi:Fe-Mn family superoxide dismutase